MLNDIQDCKDGVSYVLVFKLSRFGRNAADVLNSLQLMQDFGVNLICVEDGIDSSKDAGKLMISVLSAVAEIERENIRTQTMAGREQKAREGKWNGGFAPYGYKLENGNLIIAEDEVEVTFCCPTHGILNAPVEYISLDLRDRMLVDVPVMYCPKCDKYFTPCTGLLAKYDVTYNM